MKSEKLWRVWWIGGIPAAWGTSALVLGIGAPGYEALGAVFLAFWVCYAAYAVGRKVRQRAVASFIALALPLQGIAGVSLEARGPAHFHSGSLQHSHRQVEHHHHAAGADAVIAEQGRPLSSPAATEKNRWPDTAALLLPAADFRAAPASLHEEPDDGSLLHSPPPQERPPRI